MVAHPDVPAAPRTAAALAAPALLVAVGGLLALNVVASKAAAAAGAQMLWFLVLVFGGAGLLLAGVSFLTCGGAPERRLVPYALGAGVFAAAPSGMGYLSVAHVGAAYMSLTFAFPVLLTFVLAALLGLERPTALRVAGVAAGLAGGLVLALGKSVGAPAALGWTLLASAVPLVLAAGNIYRSRFWPRGAAPLPLAALTLLAGALLAVPVAWAAEGAPRLATAPVPVALGATAIVALQFPLQFRLQRLAGPVYMSMIGSVAAVLGAALAVGLLGERLPQGFWPGVALVTAGAAVFQAGRRTA